MNIKTVGSICSGIEAASVAWSPLGFKFQWFSEIADFPSLILKEKYPNTQNVGDMINIPKLLLDEKISAPDLLCGGTPCQAFSLAGWKNGLEDERGNLTLQFVETVNSNDMLREKKGLSPSVVFWENVEGVLKDKTNAFGCLVSSLAGLDEAIEHKKWPNAGFISGPKRNVAWRVLDAKYFGLPQQRRRVYLLAGGKDFHPEDVLFEINEKEIKDYPESPLEFEKNGSHFKIFREYTDCLYSAYGTKWNGNAAAYNGSLFVVQNGRIRRFSPLECERLMGFPDNYTYSDKAKRTPRYQAIGNSWAVPVISWIGKRLKTENPKRQIKKLFNRPSFSDGVDFWDLGEGLVKTDNNTVLNCTQVPENVTISSIKDIVSADAPEQIYISPVGCFGMIRRKNERSLRMNPELEKTLIEIANQMSPEDIEKKSRRQKRGRFSKDIEKKKIVNEQLALF
ncbi:DNA cytosine methyltransferase [Salipaludibacillus sp. CUR1]|uniref:DNA cytosine methyltransferase n=1 Tax=Salipaludibacillus sp. CUR1 TaxID=2820003 RepID=UPI001E36783E|nr:DNA cytosine methyltransferase [Salipaludibacillus sp. CUR1]MCE7792213.1 DNA cytosine methyltransferase [Salipaludibacillus sp. CUR1]